MNNSDDSQNCLNNLDGTTNGLKIATTVLSLLLVLSEIAPYLTPKYCCNGIVQSFICRLTGHKCVQVEQ